MALIEAIHKRHEQLRRLDPSWLDESCVLCVEARERAEKGRPAWWGHLTARELTTPRGAA